MAMGTGHWGQVGPQEGEGERPQGDHPPFMTGRRGQVRPRGDGQAFQQGLRTDGLQD